MFETFHSAEIMTLGKKARWKKFFPPPLSRDFRGVSKVRGGRRNRFSPRGELIPAYPQGGPRTPGASRATRIQTKRNGKSDQQSQKRRANWLRTERIFSTPIHSPCEKENCPLQMKSCARHPTQTPQHRHPILARCAPLSTRVAKEQDHTFGYTLNS